MYQLIARLVELENLLRQGPVSAEEIIAHIQGYAGNDHANKVKLWRDITCMKSRGLDVKVKRNFQGQAYYWL